MRDAKIRKGPHAKPRGREEDRKGQIMGLSFRAFAPSRDTFSSARPEIERRFSVADALEATIDQSLARAEALRQSLLQKAFRGELVPQAENA